jgi:CysZ protein
LSEAVETKLLNQTQLGQSWADILKGAPAMIWNELKKLAYVLLWVIPLLILSIIPVLNFLAPPLWLYFSSWMLAIDYHDYPMGNHQLNFPQQRALLKQKRGLSLGFGIATLTATMIPFINFLVIPAAVADATALYHDQFKAIENK